MSKNKACSECISHSPANQDTFGYCMKTGDHSPVPCENFKFRKERKSIKVEVEIEFEYDPLHFNVVGMGENYVDAIAKDMVFQNAARNIQDGVRLIHVCNRDEDAWWLINANQ